MRRRGIRAAVAVQEEEQFVAEEQEALILKDVSAEGDTEAVYEIVEDEKELKAVADLFSEILEDTEFVF